MPMPVTAAPRMRTRTVRNRLNHLSWARAVGESGRGCPIVVTGGLLGMARDTQAVFYNHHARKNQLSREPLAARLPLVRAVPPHEVVDLVVGVDRLAGVAPEPIEHVVLHAALRYEKVIDV